jgi:hypothetical protein
VINWIVVNRQWLFSGVGIVVISWLIRAGYNRWRERQRPAMTDGQTELSHVSVRRSSLASKLPGFVLRTLYNPDDVRRKVKVALRNDAPGRTYLSGQVPSVVLNFQVTNLSAVDLVLDRMCLDVWFGQPTFSSAMVHRYVIPAGDITDGIQVQQMLADNQRDQIAAFERPAGGAGQLAIYITAYFESKLGWFSVRESIERPRL